MQQGRLDEAARQTQKACDLDSQSYDGWLQLGQVELMRNNVPRAVDCFAEALRLRPDSSLAHTGMGDILLQQGRTDEGIGHLREAVRLDPDFGRGHFMLATALEGRGDLAGAAEHFEQAVRYSADFGPAWYKVGLLRVRQGRTSDAVSCLARAVRRAPDSAEIRTAFLSAVDTLAAEQARAGRIAEAVATIRKAQEEATGAGLPELAAQLEALRRRYDSGVAAPGGRP
jgi:cytochrome c-type biogenesis protein CcmH/NrfG